MTKKIGLGILLAMMALAASAATTGSSCTAPQSFADYILSLFTGVTHCPGTGSSGNGSGVTTVKAPEIDPSSAMAGLTLMSAGLVVLRGRRKSK